MPPRDFTVRGVITALVTPYDDSGNIDEKAMQKLVEFQIGAGVHGLNPCGTTGEHALLTVPERRRIAEIVVGAARHRVPVFIQTGTPSTAATIELTRHAREIGADAATVVAPYYYRYSDEAIVEHYRRVAESVPDFPVFLYNIPQHTINNLTPAIVSAIAERSPNVVGMKDSSGNLQQVIDSASARGGRFVMAEGSDGLILSAMAVGIPASVSGNANVVPELFAELFQAFWRGDLATAQAAQGKIQIVRRFLRDGSDLSLFKALLAKRGLAVGGVRPPMLNAPPEIVQSCIGELEAHGIRLSPI